MNKKSRVLSIFSAFLVIVGMTFSALPVNAEDTYTTTLNTSGEVSSKNNYKTGDYLIASRIQTLIDTIIGKRFTQNGKPCSHGYYGTCSNCNVRNVLRYNSDFSSLFGGSTYQLFGNSWTCLGFAKFVNFYYSTDIDAPFGISRQQISFTVDGETFNKVTPDYFTEDFFNSNLKYGDYLIINHASRSGYHAAIYCGCDSEGVTLLESNYQAPEKISLSKRKWKTLKKEKNLTVSRSTNYVSEPDPAVDTVCDIGNAFDAFIEASDSKQYLTVNSDDKTIYAADYSSSEYQIWHFERQADGYYKITNPKTGLVIDDYGGNVNNGNRLQGWENNDSTSQRWGIFGYQTAYRFSLQHAPEFMIDAGGGNGIVHLWEYNAQNHNQVFTIRRIVDDNRFSEPKVTNITKNDAHIAVTAYKPSEAKALKYGIDIYAEGSSDVKHFEWTAGSENVGKTWRKLTIDMVSEAGITLEAGTKYNFTIFGLYSLDGAEVRYVSGVNSFTTKS